MHHVPYSFSTLESSSLSVVTSFSLSLCISTYLNMDAIDGKQARRTGTSGPLGELFDHGCDAINMMLMSVLIPFIFNIPFTSLKSLFMSLAGYAGFFASTWEEYHTGTLYLDYISGPVEGAWSVVLAGLISALYGPQIWDTKIFPEYQLMIKDLIPIILITGSLSTIVTSFRNSMAKSKLLMDLLKDWRIPSIYFTSCAVLALLIPSELARWFIFLTGFPACFRISSTIIAYVTKSPLKSDSPYPLELIPLLLLISKSFLLNDTWIQLFKSSVIISMSIYLATMILIIKDICNHLDIYCLRIKSKSE